MDEVWVTHPTFGQVKFTGATARQKDVLEYYTKLFEKVNLDSVMSEQELTKLKSLHNEEKRIY